MPNFAREKPINALQAKSNAQKIAFAPIVFQATLALRDLGILKLLMREKREGMTVEDIAQELDLTLYGVKVLLEAGLGAEVVHQENDRYHLSKTGFFILTDNLTQVNMNFVADVCYKPMTNLQEAITTGEPSGLEELGPWNTIYEGLTRLPEKARKSWFEFDHFYSDVAFPQVLAEVFQHKPRHIVDVGGNTGKWAIKCLGYDDSVSVTLLDLPRQIEKAQKNVEAAGLASRFNTMPVDLLGDGDEFPSQCDVIWMSQFLDCFSEEEVTRILTRARGGMGPDTSLYILEPYWDRQEFDAAAFSLVNTSLYFTCIANGNSKMYHSDDMKACALAAGLELQQQIDNIGIGHTLLEYTLPKAPE